MVRRRAPLTAALLAGHRGQPAGGVAVVPDQLGQHTLEQRRHLGGPHPAQAVREGVPGAGTFQLKNFKMFIDMFIYKYFICKKISTGPRPLFRYALRAMHWSRPHL